jgi:hypothetical protein
MKQMMIIAGNARARLVMADRERFNENDWVADTDKGAPKTDAKKEAQKKDNELIDKLRAKIKDESAKIKDKKDAAKEAQQKLVEGLKKRANELWKKWSFNDVPLYKLT